MAETLPLPAPAAAPAAAPEAAPAAAPAAALAEVPSKRPAPIPRKKASPTVSGDVQGTAIDTAETKLDTGEPAAGTDKAADPQAQALNIELTAAATSASPEPPPVKLNTQDLLIRNGYATLTDFVSKAGKPLVGAPLVSKVKGILKAKGLKLETAPDGTMRVVSLTTQPAEAAAPAAVDTAGADAEAPPEPEGGAGDVERFKKLAVGVLGEKDTEGHSYIQRVAERVKKVRQQMRESDPNYAINHPAPDSSIVYLMIESLDHPERIDTEMSDPRRTPEQHTYGPSDAEAAILNRLKSVCIDIPSHPILLTPDDLADFYTIRLIRRVDTILETRGKDDINNFPPLSSHEIALHSMASVAGVLRLADQGKLGDEFFEKIRALSKRLSEAEPVTAQPELPAPEAYPADVMALPADGRADQVVAPFIHNQHLVIGGGGITGLAENELARLQEEQARYEKGKAKIAGLAKEHGRRNFGLSESVAVVRARSTLESVRQARIKLDRQREQYFQNRGIDPGEAAKYEQWFQVEQMLSASNPDEAQIIRIARTSGVDSVDNLVALRAKLKDYRANNSQYGRFIAFEEGGEVTEIRGRNITRKITVEKGRVALSAEFEKSKKELEDAFRRQEAVKRASEGIRRTLPKRERALLAHINRVNRIVEAVTEDFVPDAVATEQTIGLISEYSQTEAKLRSYQADMEDPGQPDVVIKAFSKKGLTKGITDTGIRLANLRDGLADLTDPRRRLAKAKVLAKGMELADQANLDPATLSMEDQFQLAVVETLLGRSPRVTLRKVAAAAPAPAPAAPPSPGELPPEDSANKRPNPVRRKAGETITISGMTAAELGDMGYDILANLAYQLTPQQVAGLPEEVRHRMEREGLLSATQYGEIPVYDDIAKLANGLEQIPDDKLEAACAQLRANAKAQGPEAEAEADKELLLEEIRARIAGVLASDAPQSANQPMTPDTAKPALEKNLASTDKGIAGRARTALKLLGVAGFMAVSMAPKQEEQQH